MDKKTIEEQGISLIEEFSAKLADIPDIEEAHYPIKG